MKFDCPRCQQSIEVDDTLAGKLLSCPTCQQSVLVPVPVGREHDVPGGRRVDRLAARGAESDGDIANHSVEPTNSSPVHAPLQPSASPVLVSPGRTKSRKFGCETPFWLIIAAALTAFGYVMHQWQTSPKETLTRLVHSVQRSIYGEPPTDTEEVIETEEEGVAPRPRTKPTPRPDRLPWLVEHKAYWPPEVILREPQEFPAVSNGKTVGSLQVPAGSAVKVLEITREEVAADYMGGQRRVPIAATDLASRTETAFAKAEMDRFRGATTTSAEPVRGTTDSPRRESVEDLQNIREATREEISKGLGAMYTQKATTFRIFVPTAKAVSIAFYDDATGDTGRQVRPLRQQPNGIWDATVNGDLRGKFYTFLLDAKDSKAAREVLDPYAVNAVASSTRARVTPMSTGVTSGPRLESPTDAIIYEMHVRDFTVAPNSGVKEAGVYLGWTEEGTRLPDDPEIKTALDHLTELGVTHVQLMPAQDFENEESTRNYNWGYITSAFFSPEGMFASNPNNHSRVPELKALVTALHARGIGVIMDVVYNHTSGKTSLFAIAPEYYYRRATDGSLANGSGCGNEVKSEAPMARRLIIDSLKFWVKEYGFDGFRFDLMALIDQETMRQADRELRAINPNIVIYGEPWAGGTTPLVQKTDKNALRQVPVGAFNDDFRNALKGQPDGNEPGWIQNGSKRDDLKRAMLVSDWFASPGQSLNYMTCHDNLVLWDKLMASMPNASDALRIETMKLGYLALFTSQGVPFFHGGEEFARSKGGNHNSYESPDAVNQVDWSLKKEHLDLFTYVRDLIALRKAHPMFRLRTKPQVQSRVHFIDQPNRDVLMFTVNGEGVPGESWKRACVILNSADENDATVVVPGEWVVALNESGAVPTSQSSTLNSQLSGKITIRHKSGAVLFQK